MFHPLGKSTAEFSTSELENKLTELRTKYLRATNPQVRNQINMFIAEYTEELKMRWYKDCLLYTSPSPRDQRGSRMPSSA